MQDKREKDNVNLLGKPLGSRDEILALLRGESIGRLPVFSVLPSVTSAGLASVGARFAATHTDSRKMAAVAASAFKLFGWESAVVPFDLCVEAEAFGCKIDYQKDVDVPLAPVVSQPLDFDKYFIEFGSEMKNAKRVPLVARSIRALKTRVGDQIVVGAVIPGAFTLAWQTFGADQWLTAMNKPSEVDSFLETAVDFLKYVARYYRKAGADFITIHEMGGSPQAIGEKYFRRFVQPALKKLLAQIEPPTVLSMCGDTNTIVRDLAECGASALHFDQRNDLARTRRVLGEHAVLLGNLDPFATLANDPPKEIEQAIDQIARDVNALAPGCDLAVDTPSENMRAAIEIAWRI